MSKEIDILGPFTPSGFASIPTLTGAANDPLAASSDAAKYFLFESEATERRLSNLLRQQSKEACNKKHIHELENCLSSADGVFASVNAEEEILVSGKTVVWSAGGVVRKIFTIEQPIIQAMIANFNIKSEIPSKEQTDDQDRPNYPSDLVVLHTEGLRIFCADGKTFSVAVPGEMERIWPLPTGILLQRAPPKSVSSLVYNINTPTHLGDNLPTLYSLLHPLEEVRPLSFLDFQSSLKAFQTPNSNQTQSKNTKQTGKAQNGENQNTPNFRSSNKLNKTNINNSNRSTNNNDNDNNSNNINIINNKSDQNDKDNSSYQRDTPPVDPRIPLPEQPHSTPSDLFICAPKLRLIYSSSDVPLLVLYNEETRLHSIWLIRKDVPSEYTTYVDSVSQQSSPVSSKHNSQLQPIDIFQYTDLLTKSPQTSFSSNSTKSSSNKRSAMFESFEAGFRRDPSYVVGQQTDRSPLRSDLKLEHIYTEIPSKINTKGPQTNQEPNNDAYQGSNPANHVFLLATPSADLVLCFMMTDKKTLFLHELSHKHIDSEDSPSRKLKTLAVTRIRALPCLSAAPLKVMDSTLIKIASRLIKLSPTFVLLDLNHRLSLYSMTQKICDCTLPEDFIKLQQPEHPTNRTPISTNLVHRTPKSSRTPLHAFQAVSATKHNVQNSTVSALKTPQTNFLSPRLLSSRSLRTMVFSPMSPESPFHLHGSDMDLSLSLDDDMSTDGYPITPLSVKKYLSSTSRLEPIQPDIMNSRSPLAPGPSGKAANSSYTTPARNLTSKSDLFFTPNQHSSLEPLAAASSSTPLAQSNLQTKQNKIVEILQSVSNRFCVLFEDGSVYRVCLNIAPKSPQIVECLRAANSILPTDGWNVLLRDYISWNWTLKGSGLDEWETFGAYLLALFPCQNIITDKIMTSGKSNSNKSSVADDDEDWNFLITSDYHSMKQKTDAALSGLPCPSSIDQSSSTPSRVLDSLVKLSSHSKSIVQEALSSWSQREDAQNLVPFLPRIFHALHLLCENMKLSNLTVKNANLLSQLLLEISDCIGWSEYASFYAAYLGFSVDKYKSTNGTRSPLPVKSPGGATPQSQAHFSPMLSSPPSIFVWLQRCLSGIRESFPLLREANQPCELTRKICRIYHTLRFGAPTNINDDLTTYFEPFSDLPVEMGARLHKTPRSSPVKTAKLKPDQQYRWIVRARLAVSAIEEEFGSLDALESLSFGVLLPIREVLYTIRYNPPSNWPLDCYRIVGRNDLASQTLPLHLLPKISDSRLDSSLSALNGAARNDVLSKLLDSPYQPEGRNPPQDQDDPLKTSSIDGTELINPASLMRFSADDRIKEVARLLRSSRPIHLPADASTQHQSDEELMKANQARTMVMAQRQMALSIGRGMFTIGTEVDSSKSMSTIKVCTRIDPLPVPTLCVRSADGQVSITIEPQQMVWPEFDNGVAAGLRIGSSKVEKVSTVWITSFAQDPSSTNAGILFAMGIQGHLNDASPVFFYKLLSQSHALTSAALLLGSAIGSYGTRSVTLMNCLATHFPPLGLSQLPMTFDVIKPSVALAIGLLYAETSNRHIVEILLAETGGLHHDIINNRESYALNCGLGLGFVCLAQGRNMPGLADLDIVKRLTAMIEGSNEPTSTSSESVISFAKLNSNARRAGGLISSLSHDARYAQVSPMFEAPSLPPIRFGPFEMGSEPQAPSKVSDLKSNQKPILVRELSTTNKDVSGPAAVLALCLIFLKTEDSMIASTLSIPQSTFDLAYVRPDMMILRTIAKNLIMWNTIQPSVEWINSQLPNGALEVAAKLLGPANQRDPVQEKQESFSLLKSAFICASAGACMALGLKYAGSLNQQVYELLLKQISVFLKLFKVLSHKLDKIMVETGLLQVVLASSLVMAGTGDLQLLRILRKLRKRLGVDKKSIDGIYGYQMAIGMATGFLFLGGGLYSLSNSNKSIAALLCSLYPTFPMTSNDTKYHLPMLRHLYTMACEPRYLESRDVATLRPCFVPMKLTVRSGLSLDSREVMTPCLLPPLDSLVKIEIHSPQYMRSSWRPDTDSVHMNIFQNQHYLLVQKKPNTQLINSKALPEHLELSFLSEDPSNTADWRPYLEALSDHPHIQALVSHLANDTELDQSAAYFNTAITHNLSRQLNDYKEFLFHCLKSDKAEVIPIYLWILSLMRQFRQSGRRLSSQQEINNLQLILAFYENGVGEHISIHKPEIYPSLNDDIKPRTKVNPRASHTEPLLHRSVLHSVSLMLALNNEISKVNVVK